MVLAASGSLVWWTGILSFVPRVYGIGPESSITLISINRLLKMKESMVEVGVASNYVFLNHQISTDGQDQEMNLGL